MVAKCIINHIVLTKVCLTFQNTLYHIYQIFQQEQDTVQVDVVKLVSSHGRSPSRTKRVIDTNETLSYCSYHPLKQFKPNLSNVSVASIPSEQYSLSSQPSSIHENGDELLVGSNMHSVYMCVFDSHGGLRVKQFLKRYMKEHVFGKLEWDTITKSKNKQKMEDALTNYIQQTDVIFFQSIEPFIFERQRLQLELPKVIVFIVVTHTMIPMYHHQG